MLQLCFRWGWAALAGPILGHVLGSYKDGQSPNSGLNLRGDFGSSSLWLGWFASMAVRNGGWHRLGDITDICGSLRQPISRLPCAIAALIPDADRIQGRSTDDGSERRFWLVLVSITLALADPVRCLWIGVSVV